LNGSATLSNGYLLTLTLPITFNSNLIGQTGTATVGELGVGNTVGSIKINQGNITISPLTTTLTATQTQQLTATVTNQVAQRGELVAGSPDRNGFQRGPVHGAAEHSVATNGHRNGYQPGELRSHRMDDRNPFAQQVLRSQSAAMTITSGSSAFNALHNITAASGFTANGSASVVPEYWAARRCPTRESSDHRAR